MDFDFGFFELVNFGVDGFEGVEVAGAVEGAAGGLGEVGEGFFVDFVAGGEEAGADAGGGDGVDFDVEGFGGGGGVLGGEGAGVVGAVGEEDDDFAFGVALPEAVDGGGDAVADGGSAAVEHAGVEALDALDEPGVVEGEGGDGVGEGGEADDADAVVGAVLEEAGDDVLGGVEAADALVGAGEVAGVHGFGEVE